EYDRVIAEWVAYGRLSPGGSASPAGISVAELVLAYWPHAEKHYRHPDGTPTNEVNEMKYSLRPLVFLCGDTPVRDFGPLKLKAVRELMVTGYTHPKYGPQEALARKTANQRVGRVRRVFRWGVENELVPPSVYHGLQAVKGLQKGRTDARETEP